MEPWFALPQEDYPEKHAIIIGAGIAGVSAAYALSRRGWRISLVERHAKIAQEASGNKLAAVTPLWGHEGDPIAAFYRDGFSFFKDDIVPLARDASYETGALYYQKDGMVITRPDAYVIDPTRICQHLLAKSQAQLFTEREVETLHYDGKNWIILDHQGDTIAQASVVIVASAYKAKHFSQLAHLPIQAVAGQVSYVEAKEKNQLDQILSYGGYLLPAFTGHYVLGASYHRHQISPQVTAADHESNLAKLHRVREWNLPITGGRVAVRAASYDRRPLIGPVGERDFYQQAYGDLHHGKPAAGYPEACYQKGLFVSIGHGSRGMNSGPFAGELLAQMICREETALLRRYHKVLHPERFFIRDMRRQTGL